MLKFTRTLVSSTRNGQCLYAACKMSGYSTTTTSLKLKTNGQPESGDGGQVKGEVKKKEGVGSRVTRGNNIVAAAFASLSLENTNADINTPFTDQRIEKAQTVNELLSISQGIGVSRRHALKVVSILADWSSSKKVQLSDFESDPRFIKLCKILTRGTRPSGPHVSTTKADDLTTIMNVSVEDEAAKLIASLTMPQMVKVMQTLSVKKRRSTPLLRSLAHNITRCTERLDLKQSADLLYSVSILNFADENLLERINNDIVANLNPNLRKSAVVGSILTSLGLLRYKDAGVLDALCNWVIKNHDICRPQDVHALIQTLAVLNYQCTSSEQLFDVVVPHLKSSEAMKPSAWLEVVWSLVLLNKATPEHVASVLTGTFITDVQRDKNKYNSSMLKLLNIVAVARNMNYNIEGEISEHLTNLEIPFQRSKEKEDMVLSVLDTLKNLVRSSDAYIKPNVNTQMGFCIDFVCAFDKKCTPVSMDNFDSSSGHTKIAIMVLHYPDMCRKTVEPTGLNVLAMKLLEAQEYKILQVPYHEYKMSDKLVQRVKFLESRLKSLVK